MSLPPPLRHAVDAILEGVPLSVLATASAALSQRYRQEVRDGRLHLSDEQMALAYLAARLPATYAAVRAAMGFASETLSGFSPATMLDVGAGPGTSMWAAADCWPGLSDMLLIEASPAIRAVGERLAAAMPAQIVWRAGDALALPDTPARDLVTLAYVLGEISEGQRESLVDRLWRATAGLLLIVEPGTPAGWQRILAARDRLMAAGARIAAPCPHALACPLAPPDWCHFAARVARSKMHRRVKDADVPWEDEKFIYLAASRLPVTVPASRIIAPPQARPGRVRLKLCEGNGAASWRLVTRREGVAFKAARRSAWGDTFGD